MPALRPTHFSQIEQVLKRLGYEHHRTKGSHAVWVKSGMLMHVTVPHHTREVPVGTISSIIRQIGISRDEFIQMLSETHH